MQIYNYCLIFMENMISQSGIFLSDYKVQSLISVYFTLILIKSEQILH